jgi:orotidine-5'-phosphate decarboxylase
VSKHFADRLTSAIQDKGAPVCVGIDPNIERFPAELARQIDPAQPIGTVRTFCMEVLETVAPIVPAVKPQIAYFEVFGSAGVQLYFDVVAHARKLGLIVIGDAKRGDIGSTAAAYATAHLQGPDAVDALTVNTYFGADGLAPFIDVATRTGRGIFALVRTSNPSASALQDLTDAEGTTFYEHVADHIAQLGRAEKCIGQTGLSCVGAVVGATWPDQARRLRERMGEQIFLVPGYGAQGASAADCAASFLPDGTGAIVNASRSVIYATSEEGSPWQDAVAAAARAFAADIAAAVRPA